MDKIKKFNYFYFLFLGIIVFLSKEGYALSKNCVDEKIEFKKLYIELQKSLNYEGRDAYLDGKGIVQLKPHKNEPYEGKIFEEALFREYQNSLRKVALIYQSEKFNKKTSSPSEQNQNPALVSFIKAIDDDDNSNYIISNNVNDVIDKLQKSSEEKFQNQPKLQLNSNDKYLLKKLLTHAQDRIYSIEKYQKTGNRDRNFTVEELEKKKNAPLNQLIHALKDAKITSDTDIKLDIISDEKVAINSAIASNINALSNWAKKNATCLSQVKNRTFISSIQAGIQACNYEKFIETLSKENTNNLEGILHFINANEKFLKGIQPKAETAMDELKLQAYVDRALAGLSNKIHCTLIDGPKKDSKRLFVRNLPYSDSQNKFDTSNLICSMKKNDKGSKSTTQILSEKECTSKIELISDELGRGLEVKQKNPNEGVITFSVKDNSDCQNIDLESTSQAITPSVTPVDVNTSTLKSPEICLKEGEALVPKKVLVPSEDKKTCIEKEAPKEAVKETPAQLTEETCRADGDKILSEDKKSCVEKKKETLSDAQKICDEKNEALKEENEGRPQERWKVVDNKCIDSKAKPKTETSREVSDPPALNLPSLPTDNKTPPPPFIPVNIPTRQMYILPGMP